MRDGDITIDNQPAAPPHPAARGTFHPDGLPPGQRPLAMLAVAIAVCLAVLDASIANIALPTIAQDLHATPAQSVWVVNAYQLAVTISLLPFSSLGDVYGHRRVYCWGLALYSLATIGCSVAPTMHLLILARVLQGFGGAGIMSVNGALIRFIFPRSSLGKGVGYNVLVVSSSAAAGPSVAAAILAFAPWPYLFAMQMPFAVLAMLLGLRYLPYSPLSSHGFDPASAVLNAFTLGLFIMGLDGIGHGQPHWLVITEMALCVVIGVVFVRRQLRLSAPMLPVDLFRRPVFSLSVATATCAHGAQMIMMIAMPFYFQYVTGLSPIEIGAMITPWPAVLVVVGPIAGRLADRYPAGLLGGGGLAVMTLGLLLVLFMPASTSQLDVAWRLALCGLGFGFFQSPNNRILIGSAPPDRAGAGSGMLSTSRLVGQTTGSALVAVVFGLTHGTVQTVGSSAHMCFAIAACSSGLATVLSTLRLFRPTPAEELA